MEDLISQVPITSSDSDHTAAFEQFYGKDFGRSVHLCITGPDGKSTMEIVCQPCLTLSQVIDRLTPNFTGWIGQHDTRMQAQSETRL